MSVNLQIEIAGFGGQGILFTGKFLAYTGLIKGYEVSWLPSYGPEMRGGTATCSVIISDTPIGSPIVVSPNVLVVMNLPSFDKFENTVVPGGKVIVDSTLVLRKALRDDVENIYIPATQLANDNGIPKLANMIILGRYLKEAGLSSPELIEQALKKTIPPSKAALLEKNMQAINIGLNYQG